jgi:hypothetical protein
VKIPTDQQIQIMRLALGMSGLPCNNAGAETVILVHAEMKRLGKKFSLKDATDIEYHIQRKYYSKKITVESKKEES